MKNRRRSRILALHMMYAYDLRAGEDIATIIRDMLDSKKYPADLVGYATILAQKAAVECSAIDSLLQQHTSNWDIRRMSAIDRNILRIAVAELTAADSIPFRVVIDEAVEIAKKYGTVESGKFVNGILDAVYKHLSSNAENQGMPGI